MNNNVKLLALKSEPGKFSIDTFKEKCQVTEFDNEADLITTAKAKQGNAVIAFKPSAELVQAVFPLSVLAIGEATFKMPDGCIRKVPLKTTFFMAESNIRAIEEEQRERGLIAVVSTVPSVSTTAVSKIIPNAIPSPAVVAGSTNGKSEKSQVRFPDASRTPIPPGTKMVHINYRGVMAYGEIDADGMMVWNGKRYKSLTACSNEVTHAIFDFLQEARTTEATTTGTRNWFPEDTPANAEMRKLCHKDKVKTEGIVWKPLSLELAPNGKPKRGRIKTVATPVVPVSAQVDDPTSEEEKV